jgi:N6-adenosine-specific RNA methylase IME4
MIPTEPFANGDADHRRSLRPVRGKFRTIVIDCPWQYPGMHRARPDYATMTHEELMALPVRKWAEAECHLYLWSTNGTLSQALELMGHWGVSVQNRADLAEVWARTGGLFQNDD